MTTRFRSVLLLWGCVGSLGLQAAGQARPTASAPGFALPTLGGSLRYSLSASESLTSGLYAREGLASSTNISGNLAFITPGVSHPLSLVYSGGYQVANSGQPSSFFQSLAVSQRLMVGRWDLTASDAVNYLPQTPTTGLSGIPGIGDAGLPPVGTTTGLGILTNYGARVMNTTAVGVSRRITGPMSFQGGGSYTFMRFLSDNSSSGTGDSTGLDNATTGVSGGINYRIDARNNAGANYSYGRSTYGGSSYSFTTQGVSGYYNRLWSRRLSTTVSGGPLLVSSPAATSAGSSINFSAAAGVSLTGKQLTTSLNYLRSVGNGSGVIQGSVSDSLVASLRRSYGPAWALAGSLGYAKNRSLPGLTQVAFASEGVTATAQATRFLNRHTSAYASYTVANQSLTSNVGQLNAFSGIYQIVGFGLSYSPSPIRLGSQQ